MITFLLPYYSSFLVIGDKQNTNTIEFRKEHFFKYHCCNLFVLYSIFYKSV